MIPPCCYFVRNGLSCRSLAQMMSLAHHWSCRGQASMHVKGEEIFSLSQRESSEVSDGLCPGDVPGFKIPTDKGEYLRGDRVLCMQGKRLQKNSVRRTGKMCWPDRLLFMAIAGCLLSASEGNS